MKKTVTINLNGTVFNIEEDAYASLKAYLDSIKSYFENYDDSQEIMSDIEARAAERFNEKLSAAKQVVTLSDVDELMQSMGTVADIAGTEKIEATKETPKAGSWTEKKLFRDPDNAMIYGVAAGIAAYLGIDVVFVRLAFVASLFFGGAGILLYIILCFIVPEAKTPTEKMQMQGEQVTLSNVKSAVEEKVTAAGKNIAASKPLQRLATALGSIIKVAATILAIVVGIALIVASLGAFTGIFFAFGNLLFNSGSQYIDFPIRELLSPANFLVGSVALLIVGVIPAAFLMFLGISLVRRKLVLTLTWGITFLILWIFAGTTVGVMAIGIIPQYQEKANAIENSERMTRAYDVKDFNSINVQGNQKITVVRGDEFKVEAVGREADLAAVNVSVDGQALKIRANHQEKICILCLDYPRTPEITITMPQLTNYKSDGVVKSNIAGFNQPELTLDLSGVSNVSAEVNIDKLTVETDGVSKLYLVGSSENMRASMNGASTLEAANFQVKQIAVDIDGPSRARLWATEKLDISSDGPSRIDYKGDPIVTKDIHGPSRIEKQ